MAGRKVRPIALINERQPANRTLIRYWRSYVTFIKSRQLSRFVQWAMLRWPDLVDDLQLYSNVTNCSARAFAVQGQWGQRGPLLSLSESDINRGRAALSQLGVPEGAWHVCIHARSAGYSPSDERFHSHRNVELASYMPAIDEIISRGGWCIRMGDPTMEPSPHKHGFVDYAVSTVRSEWLDMYLCATCRLFVGCTSGLYVLASIFGRPSALTNMTPLDCAYSPFPSDISIPRMMAKRDGTVMHMDDIFQSGVSGFRLTEQYIESGVSQIPNTDTEILELVRQALDEQEHGPNALPDDEALQHQFRAHFKDGAYCWPPASRIGRDYLRRHRDLI